MTVDWLSRTAAPVVELGPGSVDLHGYRGDDFTTRFAFRYSNGTPVVLDGTWRAQIKATPSDTVALGSFAVDASDQAAGLVTIHLSAAQTTSLPQRSVWDLENTAAAGVRSWFAGGLYLGGDVTR